ncbi:hypothetical protein ATCC90586_009900 [Pythium insidiosum]|nr:hypothetical protein ATCC90586_009900 [Pythium insidiosum]
MASLRTPSSASSASSAALDAAPRAGAGAGDEIDDEKVYYGFGVFMGLPLADLRAMKDEFQQKQAMALGHANGNGNGNGHSLGHNHSHIHSLGHGHSHGHGLSHGHGHHDDGGAAPTNGMDARRAPLRDPMGRPHPGGRLRLDAPSGHRMAPPFDGGAPDRDGHQSDGSDGSDGSLSAQKSHSLNFILH